MASGLGAARAPCGRCPRPLLCQHCDVRSEFLAINMVRIEVAANPFLEFSVSLMSGIADRVEEFGIAPGTANVFWRATCADINQSRRSYAPKGFHCGDQWSVGGVAAGGVGAAAS